MDNPQVFISHAHADNAACDRYAEALRARGFDVWYDRTDLQGGSRLSDEIQRELTTRSAFIVMLTPASVNSFWVQLETDAYRALMPQDSTRLMLPVRIRPCDIPVLLGGTKWLDAVDVLFDEVVELISNALSATPARTATHVLRRRFSRRTVIMGSAGLIALAAAGGIALQRVLTRTPSYPFTPHSVLYTCDEEGQNLYAINVADGSIRWKFATNSEFLSLAPRVLGQTVYLGTDDGLVYALDGDSGKLRWQQEFPGAKVISVLAPGDGATYVSAGPPTVYDHVPYVTYALDAASGRPRWQASDSAAFLAQGAVFAWVQTSDSNPTGITLLDSGTGQPQWTYRPDPPLGTHTYLQAPILANGMLYVGTWDDTAQGATGPLFAIDAQKGVKVWRHDTLGEITFPVVDGQSVYVCAQDANRSVSALNTSNGSLRWSVPITPRIPDDLGDPTELLVAGGVVYFSSDGVYELDSTDGTVIAHYLTGEGVDSMPMLAGETVYVSASGFGESSFAVHDYAAVFAIARQGNARTLLWHVKLPSGFVGQIVPSDHSVYIASSGDGIYAVNVADGSIRWKFHGGKNTFTDPTFGP